MIPESVLTASPPPVHPLEQPPPAPTPPPRQQVMLHIPAARPIVVYIVLAINIAVFILRALSFPIDQDLLMAGANYGPAVLQDGEVYRLLTSMFLHSGIYTRYGTVDLSGLLHIVFNCYMIYTVGRILERLFGSVRFALIYFLGGLTGSIFSAVLYFPPVVSIGASGAVFALLAAEFVYLYKHRRLLGEAGRRQMSNLITLFIINIVFGLLTTTGASAIRVDNLAHLGGALGGGVLTWFIGPYYLPRRHPTLANALTVDDINPLNRRYGTVVLFGSSLLLILVIARLVGVGMG
jgi:rhomboid protease GluP